ncbi:MAG: HAMP domain-containing protein, partial [Gammaproteobacteria bacterium]|nr:HAMP domain-containing protein [Gammaproteobacteria bacterium]
MHSDHNKFLARAIDQRRSFIGECHRCHVEPGSPSEREMDVLAFVPLSLPPWGVSVRDPASEVYAPASALQKAFLLVSLIVVIASIALSLGLSRSIVRPLRLLTDAAGRMAEGNLSDAINVNRRDEIGKLAIG